MGMWNREGEGRRALSVRSVLVKTHQIPRSQIRVSLPSHVQIAYRSRMIRVDWLNIHKHPQVNYIHFKLPISHQTPRLEVECELMLLQALTVPVILFLA